MKLLRVGIIYKITYPNGKIYIGQDRTDDINYFGSADSFTIAKDFSVRQKKDFHIRKQILIKRRDITIQELNQLESAMIEKYASHNPKLGYNRCRTMARRHCRETWA